MEPKSLAENVPENLKYFEGKVFLIAEKNVKDDEKILIFCSVKNIKLLKRSPIWLMDGTFQCCPALFTQLNHSKKVMPLVYALLAKKTQDTYKTFLNEVARYARTTDHNEEPFSPAMILTDFEMAVINSVRIVFPETIHKGCLFHLGQSIWRRIQEFELQKTYQENGEFSLKMRHLIALAYLPHHEIPEAFNLLKETVLPAEAEQVTVWFEINYVNGRLTSRANDTKVLIHRTPPLFPPELWSVYLNYENDLPLTQNNVEAWHRRWNALLDNKKLGVYATIREIHKEQKANTMNIEKMEAGIPGTPPKKTKKRVPRARRRKKI